jgi:hypothetical protein
MSQADALEKSVYQIKVQGRLDERWASSFNGMELTCQGDATILTGPVADQSALRGILSKLWDLNLVLISVIRLSA